MNNQEQLNPAQPCQHRHILGYELCSSCGRNVNIYGDFILKREAPTISAGEAHMSFEEWFNVTTKYNEAASYHILKNQLKECMEGAWGARDPEVTALKQELVRAKERFVEAKTFVKTAQDSSDVQFEINNQLRQELAQAKEDRGVLVVSIVTLKEELAQAKEEIDQEKKRMLEVEVHWHEIAHSREGKLSAMSNFYQVAMDRAEKSEGKLAQMTEVNELLGVRLTSSEKLVAALEGKLGEMRKYFKDIEHTCGSIDRGAFNQIQEAVDGCSTIAEEALAALEPIKKEEKPL